MPDSSRKPGTRDDSGDGSAGALPRFLRSPLAKTLGIFLGSFLVFVAIWQFYDKVVFPFIMSLWRHRVVPVVEHLQANALMYLAGIIFAAGCTLYLRRRFLDDDRPKRG